MIKTKGGDNMAEQNNEKQHANQYTSGRNDDRGRKAADQQEQEQKEVNEQEQKARPDKKDDRGNHR
jgi:hypothetical protein